MDTKPPRTPKPRRQKPDPFTLLLSELNELSPERRARVESAVEALRRDNDNDDPPAEFWTAAATILREMADAIESERTVYSGFVLHAHNLLRECVDL